MPIFAGLKLVRPLLAGMLLLSLLGCPAGPPAGTIVSVTITGGNISLVIGESQTLNVTVTTSGSIDNTVAWTSSQGAVASINNAGLLTALTEGTSTITATSNADPTKQDSITATIIPAGSVLWTRQFGTVSADTGQGVATDADGNIMVTGYTGGTIEGTSSGNSDAFVRKYGPEGNHLWTRQFGSDDYDFGEAVAADPARNIIVTGYTLGAIEGANPGGYDIFVRKYGPLGELVWTRQFGTSSHDYGYGVTTDADGNIIVSGYTGGTIEGTNAGNYDVVVRKYSADGDHLWTRQFGTSGDDFGQGVTTDADGNIIVSGYTEGGLEGSNLGDYDVFVRKYDAEGNHLWTRQFGTSDYDLGEAVTTDADGNIIVTGSTEGGLQFSSAGDYDTFVRKYDAEGNHLWTRQGGTSDYDSAFGIATDPTGNIIIAGRTSGSMQGASAGNDDIFARKYSPEGVHIWTGQFGTSSTESGRGVTVDPAGDIIVAGDTLGAIEGINSGDYDAFLRKYSR